MRIKRSTDRNLRWSVAVIAALALVLAAGGNREARAGLLFGIEQYDSGFNPPPPADSSGFYAYVYGNVTPSGSPAGSTTTVDFLVSAAFPNSAGNYVSSFAFNTDSTLTQSNISVYSETAAQIDTAPTNSDLTDALANKSLSNSVSFNLKTDQNVSGAGKYEIDLSGPLNNNATPYLLVEFTVSGSHPLSDFAMPNDDVVGSTSFFAIHLKTYNNTDTGYVYGGVPVGTVGTQSVVPEPSTFVGACMAGLMGLGYAFRRWKGKAA